MFPTGYFPPGYVPTGFFPVGGTVIPNPQPGSGITLEQMQGLLAPLIADIAQLKIDVAAMRARQNAQVPEPTPIISIAAPSNPAKAVVRVRTADFVGVPLVGTKVTLTLLDTKTPIIGDIIRSTRFVEGTTDKFGEVDLETWSDATLIAAKLKPTYKLTFANVELKIRVPPSGGLASQMLDPLG